MSDVECPYCFHEQEVNHDDGYGYEEDRTHEQECEACEKTFVFTTSIHFSHASEIAPCLNGEPHSYSQTMTVPKRYTKMRCEFCDGERECTAEEKAELGYWDD